MDLKVSAQRLCLLLSWSETLQRTPHAEPYAGQRHRRVAARAIVALRAEAEGAVREAGSQLQALLATDGQPPEAKQVRHRIQQLNHLLKAQSTADLGGPIAMTLEGYADAFNARKPPPFSFTGLDRQDHITIGVSLVLVVVICLGLSWYHLWRANTTFTLQPAEDRFLALQMRNDGQRPAEFVGSWPDNFRATPGIDTYGVAIYCKPKGENTFQPCTAIGEVWVYQNELLLSTRRIAVEPGSAITVLLDVGFLESTYGVPLEAIRLECGSSGNRRQAVFTESVGQ